jgi:hypothetical protein
MIFLSKDMLVKDGYSRIMDADILDNLFLKVNTQLKNLCLSSINPDNTKSKLLHQLAD